MLAAQSPNSGNQIHHPKTVRKPLQLKNSPATPINNANLIKSNRKPRQWIEIIDVADHDSNKENIPPNFASPGKGKTESRKVEEALDASLADELNSIREKLHRMKLDKEKTEKILSDRATVLDIQMKELLVRGEEQKQMEIEVDRLFRLKELKLSCMVRNNIIDFYLISSSQSLCGLLISSLYSIGVADFAYSIS